MRRILGVIMCVVLLIGSVVSFGGMEDRSDNYVKAGTMLQQMNLIQKSDSGLNEMRELTRAEAVTLIVRMLGKEDEVMKRPVKGIFTDIPHNDWCIKYVEFAADNKYVDGVGDGRFLPYEKMSKQAMANVILKVLGYFEDWNKVLEKADELDIVDDAEDGASTINRGQSFIYVLNALGCKMKSTGKPLYEQLGIEHPYFDNAQDNQDNNGRNNQNNDQNGNQNNNQNNNQGKVLKIDRSKVKIDMREMPRPVRARPIGYDEIEIEYSTSIKQPSLDNFIFKVEDGRIIVPKNLPMGGKSSIFRFREQNLHGKEVEIIVKDLESSQGRSMVGTSSVKLRFKDYVPIHFTHTNVMSDKQFEAFLSIAVKPPTIHDEYGYAVYVNGKLMEEGTGKDYRMSWGGNRFAPLFSQPQSGTATLKVWGYVTAPYDKYMDGVHEVSVDLGQKGRQDGTPEPPKIEAEEGVAEPDYVDHIDDHIGDIFDYIEEVDDQDRMPTDVPDPTYGNACEPAFVERDYYFLYQNYTGGLYLQTNKPVESFATLTVYDWNGRQLEIDRAEIENHPEDDYYGIRVMFKGNVNVSRGKVYIEGLKEKSCGAVTPPFEYYLSEIIN